MWTAFLAGSRRATGSAARAVTLLAGGIPADTFLSAVSNLEATSRLLTPQRQVVFGISLVTGYLKG